MRSNVGKKNYINGKLYHLCFVFLCLFCIIPILSVISISVSNETNIANNGYKLIPEAFSFEAYRYIFGNPGSILNAYKISILITVMGGILGLLIMAMFAYSVSRQDFKHRNKFSFFIFFTMIFNGGLVPTYIVVARILHLSDTIWALIVPYLVSAWFIIIMRTYFQSIPMALIESAKIDGAREFRTFFTIVLPLSKPALATIGLFIVLNYWNDWFLALMYLSPSAENLIPLQFMLYRIMNNIQFLTQQMSSSAVSIDLSKLPSESARMAMCIIAAGPMLFVFPFFQKYLVKGLTVGAVKG